MQVIKIIPSPGSADASFVRSQAFLRDAKLFASIPDTVFEAAISAISSHQGFLDGQEFESVLCPIVSEADQREALIRLVTNLSEFRRDAGISPERAGHILRDSLGAAKGLEHAAADTLSDRLPHVLALHPGVEKQAKAQHVATALGGSLVEAKLISDLRPVFDDDRQRVEGLIPVTTMKVSFELGYEVKVFEVRLTEAQVMALCEESGRAKQKLQSLRKLIAKHGFPLPDTTMTVPGEDDDE
jgi:hypothetical protein